MITNRSGLLTTGLSAFKASWSAAIAATRAAGFKPARPFSALFASMAAPAAFTGVLRTLLTGAAPGRFPLPGA
ncbi:MAG: hypothetical protein LUQ35_03455 [Methanoregula sp.]|jgi:hypothetical protein|nr:hypothetical protein [Methanoregula sp.]